MDYVVECYQEEMAAKDRVEIQWRRIDARAYKNRANDQRKADRIVLKKAEALVTKDNERRRQGALSPLFKQDEKDARNAAKAHSKQIAQQDKLKREDRQADRRSIYQNRN